MSGFINKAAGNMEAGLGKIIGDEEMRKRGEDRAYQGHGQQQRQEDEAKRQANIDDAKNSSMAQKAKGAAEQAGGTLKQGAGRAVGNPGMEQAGREARDQGIGRVDKN
ncbi:hypothetical protein LPJ78_001666 [Coemansia sp. RSA 989]|nr:hypothetical protein LPJ68_003095 [Coemansia sp. RSA 1086]KAJ1751944.1 hypothetical protein LPJ79_001675 [Coemansia sp. RSA 1821]KAJ1866607.1 hypothetical protein LPJ78_001666 [Coemansia sp. RSA 989]KAJ1871017.1 hypothetical protein LPJ55_004219 [Coemansia sp. RSA 990]KAJ2632919.1 hypothetical protein H4R22_000868 [Coemansia sp. RSA 1290]KAJ2648461.1 hypothetical protein IWW40_003877 [Coemansia sp. RSA 1250]KAJ2670353.1 hypothetical protein IWW42_004055 [Coemansia sp. RSA 1085]